MSRIAYASRLALVLSSLLALSACCAHEITSAIFYVVNGEQRADHYCDFKNQPRYTAVPSVEPNVIDSSFATQPTSTPTPCTSTTHGGRWSTANILSSIGSLWAGRSQCPRRTLRSHGVPPRLPGRRAPRDLSRSLVLLSSTAAEPSVAALEGGGCDRM